MNRAMYFQISSCLGDSIAELASLTNLFMIKKSRQLPVLGDGDPTPLPPTPPPPPPPRIYS